MAIKYHFFGKECQINRALTDYKNLEENLKKQNFTSKHPAIFVNQIHSNQALTIDEKSKIPLQNNRPKADAIVTNLPNLIIGIVTADCMPILMLDDKNRIISATHAGWAGAFSNITSTTINSMKKLGSKPQNITAIIGPTIRQKSYEISEEFLDRFLKEDAKNKKFFKNGNREQHYLFDLPGYTKEKLQKDGVKNIIDDKIDTYTNEEKLFSYRRSCHLKEADCGRNVAIIQLSL
jgi:hypothetical protein